MHGMTELTPAQGPRTFAGSAFRDILGFLRGDSLVPLPAAVAGWLRLAARLSGVVAAGTFAFLVARYGIPHSIEQERWEAAIQVVLLGVALAGYLLALRWEGLGGVILCVAGVGVGVTAALAYAPSRAIFSMAVLVIPGMLFLLHWQARHSRWLFALLVAGLAGGLAWAGVEAARTYEYYWGPFHPVSETPAIPVDLVVTIWTGGVTSEGFSVRANPLEDQSPLELLVSTDRTLSGAARFPAQETGDNDMAFTVSGLEPDTLYYYAIAEGDHVDQGRRGTVRTLAQGPASFTIALGSCIQTGSNGAVFDQIRAANPLFFLIPGDFQYDNIARDSMDAFEHTYEANLLQPAQQALYLTAPTVYVWDDHDYGGDNSDRTSISRESAWQAYRRYVPHGELANPDTGPINFAFTQGRVRFVVVDGRSARDPAGTPDRSMLGDEQIAWLKSEFLAARDAGLAIAWVNTVPWIDKADDAKDTWGGFAEERHALAQFIAANGLTDRIVMLSGDAHMVAADDGTNSNYSDFPGDGFPVLHAAALDRRGNTKGGPYSEGTHPGPGQFGLLTVEDNGGDTITMRFSGRNWKGDELLGLQFTLRLR
jgi:hypothetical protein